MRTALLLAFVIAIRLHGAVEVSPDGQTWEPLIRNRKMPAYARTLSDSLGQVRTEGGVCTLGPDTLVQQRAGGLQLERGALGVQGVGKVLTPLGPVESTDWTTDAVILSQDGLVIEVYEGWVRLDRREDVDEGERAVWGKSGVQRADATFQGVPLELRPRDE